MHVADNIAVLCVDDEIEIITALKSCLRREPYIKLFAESGEEALAMLEDSSSNVHIVVLVSDIHMPGMSGIELIERVKTRFPDTICLLVSGANNSHELVKSSNPLNFFSTITKPIDIPAFKKNINDAIDYYCKSTNKQ
ncbi:MAG: response regulator [Chlorobiaceae bacterium]